MTVAVTLVLLAAATAPVVNVEVSAERIHVEASDAALADILEALASRLDVRLVFDGPRPTAAVTAALSGADLPDILNQLLEPRRIRYATTASDNRVRALVVVTETATRPTPRPVPTEVPPPEPQPFADSVPEPVLPDKASPPDEP